MMGARMCTPSEVKCACPSTDSYRCWALRYYGHSVANVNVINNEGGPCQCVCHDNSRGEDDGNQDKY